MKLVLVMAMTADGKIARDPVHFPDWTSKADKRMFKKITTSAGVVIMGARTYQAIGKPLPGRLNVVFTHRPEAFQLASDLMLTSGDPRRLLSMLVSKGYRHAILAGGATLNSLFLKYQLIDEMVLTIAPRIFGQGISLFNEPVDLHLALIDSQVLESDLLVLRYRLLYNYIDKHHEIDSTAGDKA